MDYKKLALALILPQLAGLIGSLFTAPAISGWYAYLNKPSFSPPNWLFGPVWITLYLMMGISIYLIWRQAANNQAAKTALWLFWLHLLFNAGWSVIFFGLKNPGLAMINILVIWFLIIILIVRFWPLHKTAALLLIPYLAWVSFASLLNYLIWLLN